MINPQWLELPMFRNLHGSKNARAIEVRLYLSLNMVLLKERTGSAQRERERVGIYTMKSHLFMLELSTFGTGGT